MLPDAEDLTSKENISSLNPGDVNFITVIPQGAKTALEMLN
jgi:hypothetical protein